MDRTASFLVTLGNGQQVAAVGCCHVVSIYLHSHTFFIDCYVFLLAVVDVILGISWLALLGDVKANWKSLSMEFQVDG